MSTTFPAAPPGTFRLFRLLALYPTPKILLQTFPYRESGSGLANDYNNHPASYVCPTYDAISYAWNPHPSNDVDLPVSVPVLAIDQRIDIVTHEHSHAGSITIYITRHLLYGLLTAQELCTPSWLFTDAICINQTDVRDKAVQVRGMDQVYRGARKVLVWLGIDHSTPGVRTDTQSGLGVRTRLNTTTEMRMGTCLPQIPSLVEVLEAYLSGRAHDQDSSTDKNRKPFARLTAAAAAGLPSKHDPVWPALERLRLNSWFTRLWVVQEVTLAREATLLYGNHALEWSTYVRFTALCEDVISNLFSKQHDVDLVNRFTFAYNSRVSAVTKFQRQVLSITRFRNEDRDSNSGDIASLLRIMLHVIRKSNVCLELDRVYATMGLLDDRMKECLRVVYTDEMVDTYWVKWLEMFQTMLYFAPDIAEELFSLAGSLERHPGLPSWCPNLADGSEKRKIADVLATTAGMPNGTTWTYPNDIHTATVIPNSNNIRLIGLEIDEVLDVVDLNWIEQKTQWGRVIVDPESHIDSDAAREILVTLWKCLDLIKDATGTDPPDGDAILSRCLIANAYDDRLVDSEQLAHDYLSFAWWLENRTWGDTSSGSMDTSSKAAALRFANRFQRMAKKRAFFTTKAGKAGLCSSRSCKGDSVSVFMNSRLPYLLRRVDGDSFEMVGEAYVDGMMHGEAFKDRDLTEEGPKEIIIC